MSYGDQLRAARERAGLTQTRAAKAEGVSLRLWKYWEKGEQLPPAERDVLTRERLLARWKTKARPPGSSNVEMWDTGAKKKNTVSDTDLLFLPPILSSDAEVEPQCSTLATGSPLVRRAWAMPNKDTFSIAPIGEMVRRRLKSSVVSVDPFARDKRWATHTNDLNPQTAAEYHMDARDFLDMLAQRGVLADLVLFDPPYSPRQISECYAAAGITAGMMDTQNARLYGECRTRIEKIAAPGCRVLSFGWNSSGMGARWTREEMLLVCHGGAHNDTICVCDRLDSRQLPLLEGNTTMSNDGANKTQ